MPRDEVNGQCSEQSHRALCHHTDEFFVARFLFLLVTLLATSLVVAVPAAQAEADPPPAIDGSKDEKSMEEDDAPPPVVLSFARFEPTWRAVCSDMQLDGRHARLFTLAQARAKAGQDCPSCRALWRSITSACRLKAADDSKKKPPLKGKKKQSDETEASAANEVVEPTPTPLGTPTPKPAARFPSTAVLDGTSRLSTMLYEFDPRKGGAFEAVSHVVTTLLSIPDLTVAEKDYYGIFATYLLSAWEGREDPDEVAAPKPSSKQQVNELFE